MDVERDYYDESLIKLFETTMLFKCKQARLVDNDVIFCKYNFIAYPKPDGLNPVL